MKFINPSAAAIIVLTIISFFTGCGGSSIDSSTWLIVVGEDTISVGDVGETWNQLEESQRELFNSKDNTIGEFIVTYGRKALLQLELADAGYMDDHLLILSSRAWLNTQLSEAARKLLYDRELETITDDEIDFFLSYLGRHVLYTINPGTDSEETMGPVHIPLLPADLITFLDSLSFGEIGTMESGLEIRLDSIVTADSSLIIQALADTAMVRSNAASAIATRRYQEMEDSLKQSFDTDHNLSVDSTVIEELRLYYGEEAEFPAADAVVFSSDLGSVTAEEIRSEISFYQNRQMINPADAAWMNGFIDLLLFNFYSLDLLESEDPEFVNTLRIESDKYLMDIASEEFYTDRIQSTVTVTAEYMEDLFENMEEPFTVSEKRVLQAISMHQDSASRYRDLPQAEQTEFRLRMPGFANLAADPAFPQITRPLTVSQVPGFHGEEVFLLDPADTITWMGPLDLYDGDLKCMFRLIDVIPERNSTFEEVEDQLYIMARNRLEEQATVDVIRELEEKYDLLINEEILEQLPEDPGSWIGL
ncbi:MAG: hypothetical protein ABFR50_03915 [Candidatus Fermentibacteria bacterium]